MKFTLSVAAVGDISFHGNHSDSPSPSFFGDTRSIFHSNNLVIGNLEGPLVMNGKPVPGKCCLRANPGWARVMRESGIGLVSLANNHIMDYGEAGLHSTLASLEAAGLAFVGAGRNLLEASAPLFLEVRGKRLAILARTAVAVASPSYAGDDQPGVAFLDVQETIASIQNCRVSADLVILLLHWGLEDYLYPSREQRILAERFVEAGADLILGHHPHVLQGFEQLGKALVIYSLGNFAFDEFEWWMSVPNSQPRQFFSSLSDENRKGIILNLTWSREDGFQASAKFTLIDKAGKVGLDQSSTRQQHFSLLSLRLHYPFYSRWWRLYALLSEWRLRIKPKLSFRRAIKKIHKLRPHHLQELFTACKKSSRIASGRSMNPYD